MFSFLQQTTKTTGSENQKRWIGGNHDASYRIKTRSALVEQTNAVKNASMGSYNRIVGTSYNNGSYKINAKILTSQSTVKENTIRNAQIRTRNSGYVVAPKVKQHRIAVL